MATRPRWLLLCGALLALTACSEDPPPATRPDATPDVTPDVAEAGADVGPEATIDAPPGGCVTNDDCRNNPAGNVCQVSANRCVQCVPDNDTCPPAQHCDGRTFTCVAGCRNDEGCRTSEGDAGASVLRCEVRTHTCVACTADDHCPSGNVCRGNVCVSACAAGGMACAAGQTCCAGGCVDTNANTAHCGMCDRACPTDTGAPVCSGGQCGMVRCNPGFADCDGAAGNGCEVDLQSSAQHCGGCGRACVGAPNAAPSCAMGRCAFTCNPGFADCDGMAENGCETDTRTTTAHCGMCGDACMAPARGAAACAMGRCDVGACEAGYGNCDGSGANGCEADLQRSPAHCGMCGNACPVGQTCEMGRCQIQCPSGLTNCMGACVATANDPDHCGACGMRCATGQLCGGGRCVSTCGAGQTNCSGSCSTLDSDAENCGRCDNRCGAGERCVMGACRVQCPAGQVVCGGACADLNTSLLHCGRCDARCSAGEQCMAGRCILTCPGTQVACGAECAELQRDPNHCGRCGRSCVTGCFGGDCARVADVEVGTSNTCVRYTSGRVFCWGLHAASGAGANGFLTLSGGSFGHRAAPVLILAPDGRSLEQMRQVEMGRSRACALGEDGTVRCWASGIAMAAVSGLPSVTRLSGREVNFCGLTRTGEVYCWDGAPRAATLPALTAVAGVTGAAELAAGGSFTCARTGGAVSCWGTGTSGQLGQGANTNSAAPVAVRGLTDATAVAAGQDFACAIRMGGAVVCWGANARGQLGDGSTTNRNVPTPVMGLTDATSLRLGLRHACAVRTGGAVVCWGDNSGAQLGDGTTTDRSAPVAVAGLPAARQVGAYDHHSCAVALDNTVRCWGYNPFGEAGGGTELTATPTPVAGLSNIVDLQTGAAYNYALMATATWRCALAGDGKVSCWGSRAGGNEAGQLGDGTTTQRATPLRVTGIEDAVGLAVGWQHACVARMDGSVACWGSNAFGQLGDGTTRNRSLPAPVPGLTDVVAIRSGDYHTCARRRDGTVQCWGYNFHGELGDGGMVNSSVPRAVMGLSDVVDLESGANFTCARVRDGSVRCWGRNIESQLGDGFRTNRAMPGPVTASSSTVTMPVTQMGFTSLTCDVLRCYGRVAAGTVGWGFNFGARATALASYATVVENRRMWTGDGADNECERRTDGMTYCRGRNEFGAVGDGSVSASVAAFTAVRGDFTAIRLGRTYTSPCAIERGTGRVLCWGWAGNDSLLAAGLDGHTRAPALVPMP